MNKTDKIKKKLQIVMYVLIILSILRSFIARASAEEMAYNQVDVIEEYINSELPSFSSSIISALREHVFPYCQYFGTYKISNYDVIIINFVSDISVMPVDMHSGWSSPPCQIQVGIVNSYGSRGGLVSTSSKSLSNYYGFRFIYHNGTWSLCGVKNYTGSVSNKYGDTYFGGGALVKYAGTSSASNSSWFNPWDLSWTKSHGYGPVWIASSSDRQYIIYSANNVEPLPPVDSRFHARTFKNLYNQNMLEIKWDSNVYPNTGSFTYLKSVLQLTLMVNGNQSIVSFDSDNYPDLFVTPNTSYIPYMFLDNVGNVVELQDTDSAFLTNIKLTQYAYPSSASSSSATAYTASTVYNLSLTDSVQLPVWSDPTISQQGGHIIDIATGNVYDNVSFNPPDGYSQQHLSDLESVPWADVKVISQVAVTGNSQSAIDNLYKDVAFLLMQDWKHFADSSLTDFNDIAAYIQSDNQYTDTYDIIIFLWNDTGSDLCWVTYTHRYYIRLMYKQFGNFQTVMEGSAAYVADIYDYLFSRLEPLNDNLILYFDSALSNNQTILSYVQSINGFCNSIDNTLFSGFNSVIGSGGRSLTDIYNRLGDISVGGGNSGFILNDFMTAFENKMSYLFVPTYDGLDDNFDEAIDDLGILALPFSFSYELISACKVPYSYTLDITFPSMSIPWHEEMEGGSVDSNLVLWEDYDFSFNPATVIPSDWLEFFQYLNALLVLVSVTLLTYRHIFRHSEGQGGDTL